ncbi:accessory gene regulator ArgB-like protein [Paramaledivibacter caminithermalis]|jgi:accessory gene regulator B|uniref:Accessory gene regulator B n=1 Tax=Paramaledivibacter caminithermalis (strain DSM 15212 / CIP 107654 / DViRD3) TaxID=1121301 RepID=A0A1M6RP82_PARC5|nr:accessory gene regulator B family protein [Paramaledivibacter caminithermalis]SHK34321.1 accessory gene regulator B [Paramaledivibacter caminithermalis DSM 15212]
MKKFNVDGVANNLINYFRRNLEIDKDQEAILKYSIHLVISAIFSLGFALFAALLLGIFPNVLIIILTNAILRTFSGGAHSSSMLGCTIYGTVLMNILGIITKYTHPNKGILAIIIFIVFIFSILIINKYAPADTPGKPITTKVKKQKLRKLSFSALFIWFGLCVLWYVGAIKSHMMIYASTLGVLWQCFSLTDWGYALLNRFDKSLHMIK